MIKARREPKPDCRLLCPSEATRHLDQIFEEYHISLAGEIKLFG